MPRWRIRIGSEKQERINASDAEAAISKWLDKHNLKTQAEVADKYGDAKIRATEERR